MTGPTQPAGSTEPIPEPMEPSGEPASDPEATGLSAAPGAPAPGRPPRVSQGEAPLYKGEPLDAERGPGLGCFWIQVGLLAVLLVLTPLTVIWAWDERISAVLLILTLILLLFAGQTVIFLLRLVAADRRSRRVPRSPTARRTVGMLEDETSTSADRAPGAGEAVPGPGSTTDEPHEPTPGAR